MRRFAAAVLVAGLVALAAAPHVHVGPGFAHECAACVLRGAEPGPTEPLELGPAPAPFAEVVAEPVQALPVGAPLGAIPGQSPPAVA